MDVKSSTQPKPVHRRNPSSKANILRSLVSSKSRAASPEQNNRVGAASTNSFPVLPSDHPHAAKTRVLGERQGNVQSPPTSPSKPKQRSVTAARAGKDGTAIKVPTKNKDGMSSPKKSKSSTNLSGIFAKMNRSTKDLSAVQKDKENATPPSTATGPVETPVWSQYSSTSKPASRPTTRDSRVSGDIHDEIARYTPRDYSPSKQRNFNGTPDQPSLKPILNTRPRPQSQYAMGSEGLIGAIGRRVSLHRSSTDSRRSEDASRRSSKEQSRPLSGDKPALARWNSSDRKASGSSTEQAPANERLTIAKRGGRVMAAVAAFQGKGKTEQPKAEAELDPKTVDKAFEAVLDSRNIPEPMRQKMRSLTLRVKADFIKQDQGSKTTNNLSSLTPAADQGDVNSPMTAGPMVTEERTSMDDDSKSTKRSRARSRTFTFSKADKRSGDSSPTKKHRSQSKSRPTSIHIPKDPALNSPSSTTLTSPFASFSRKGAAPTTPADYVAYLCEHQDPLKVENGTLQKLRLLLRNETVAWVDSFVSLGGMMEIVGLLHRTIALEWREEHEDQLLSNTLLCLKGLCTTERAMAELEKVADELFPALLGMLFDEEKKGPAEYTTRTVIINILFNFLASATSSTPDILEQRARRILTFLGEPQQPLDARPVDFVLDMRTPRPYKLWCREVTNVTREVFWIFLHHLNVVPRPKPASATASPTSQEGAGNTADRSEAQAATYTHRHFPGSRPPVPAAPYIGGVEWDATTYLTAHLDLLNGLIACIPSARARNTLRNELLASGFEKVMGTTLRTCKEKFYSGVHDGLRAWVAAAWDDGWETRGVREGPTQAEMAGKWSPKKSPGKRKEDGPPQLEAVKVEALPKLSLGLAGEGKARREGGGDDNDDGWLG